MTLAKRLRERRIAAGFESQAALAKACKLYPQIIQRLESGDISSTIHLSTIAARLGTTTDYLLTGRVTETYLVKTPHNEAKGAAICVVPLLTFNEIADWTNGGFKITDKTQMIPATHVSSKAFAVKVKDDSMLGAGPSFLRGDLLIVDPAQEYADMSFIIALVKETHDAYFRQLVKLKGLWHLQPLNSAYPREVLDKNYMICGVVTIMQRTFS